MGYYIEVPSNKGKAQQIVELYGGRIAFNPPLFEDISPDEAIICVVDNGLFEAAAYCYNQEELNEFSFNDGRPRMWVIMNLQKARKLTGFEEYIH